MAVLFQALWWIVNIGLIIIAFYSCYLMWWRQKSYCRKELKKHSIVFAPECKEPDRRIRDCTVFFSYDPVQELGDIISAHHWCLIFKFDDFKVMICKHEIDSNSGCNKGIYRTMESIDIDRYGDEIFEVTQINISPQQIQDAVFSNKLNGKKYDMEHYLCQHWVIELANSLKIDKAFEALVNDLRFGTECWIWRYLKW